MNERDAELLASAELGEEAKKFLEGNVGRALVGMAKQDASIALEKLALVDPDDKLKIVELQREVAFGNRFEQYLVELISRGDQDFAVILEERK